MTHFPLKRSRTLTLVAIASVSLVACGDDDRQTQRVFYPTLQECLREWAPPGALNPTGYCEPGNNGFYGPYYDYDSGARHGYYYPYGVGYVVSSVRTPAPYTARLFSSDGSFKSGVPSAKVQSYTVRGGFGGRAGRSSGYSSRSFGG